ncbi:MFS general substrate transporter [Aspergillus sclerotiicarbonarius CBS 121057]|uniref:MFS general substrate transporter n=1 Tax=Aspergillus sclerotiicarbonarius (strain CBS 121057 / IBT 28362) TaxID=1448318 RepID=A0A319E9X5_ASPSB|nr:MFS general substrate transporter [Aspergillus sclerotiicarbonarius CBS 121057]
MGLSWFSSKEPYFGLTGGWLTVWITVACATDMTLFGYDQGVFSGVVVTDNFLETLDLVGSGKTQVLSTVTAIYDVGCFLGAILAFSFGERLGRKNSIIWGAAIMAVGTILQASSYNLAQMFVGRVVSGIGNGINTTTAPVWQTETSTARWRGRLVIFEMLMNLAGYCLVNWINYGLSFHGGSVAWRFPMRTKTAAVSTATNWITNFVVAEITPIGIQSLEWKFYIIWTVFNAAFLPVIYFFYPETANRRLEDMDAYYRSNPPLIVINDPDAISVKRPLKYIQHEDEELRKTTAHGGANLSKTDEQTVEHVE